MMLKPETALVCDGLFPYLLVRYDYKNYDDIKDDLIKHIYKLHKSDPEGQVKSNFGGWHSCDNPTQNGIPQMYIDYIIHGLHLFAPCKLLNWWVNINPPGTLNRSHCHPGADLSGVFWVKIPPDSGQIAFRNPNEYTQFNLMTYAPQELQEDFHLYAMRRMDAQDGAGLLFPADLVHQVEMNQSQEDRISISFNLKFEDTNGGSQRKSEGSKPNPNFLQNSTPINN